MGRLGLECSDGLSNLRATAAAFAAMAISVALSARAVQSLPVGTAYAVRTGVGAVGTALLGIVLFDEPAGLIRPLCIGVIVAGVVGLQASA